METFAEIFSNQNTLEGDLSSIVAVVILCVCARPHWYLNVLR